MNFLRGLTAMLALLMFLPGVRPQAAPALQRFDFVERHMGTLFRISLHAPDEKTAKAAAKAGFARVAQLEAIMSDYVATSELMQLCARAGGPPVMVSEDLFRVLQRAQEVSRRSGGAFDVTVGPVVRLWRRSRRTQELPDPVKLKEALALVGFRNIVLDEKARTVRLLKAGMQLDLGGIGKGYTADEVLKVLARLGITRALVAAGGDIACGDPPPGRAGWTVTIAPLEGEKEGRKLLLSRAAVSTSGDTEQYVEIGGKRYSHIVDPRTGLGLTVRMSATVVAPTGMQTDSLTKVLCVLGPEAGFKILAGEKAVSGRVVRRTDRGLETRTSAKFPAPGRFGS